VAQVEKLAGEHKAFKKRVRHLGERLAAFESEEIIRTAGGRVIAGVLEDRTPEEARFLALAIIKRGDFAVAYGAAAGESQGHLVVARSESSKADLRRLVPVIAAVVPVKGGGGPSLIELVTSDKGRLKEVIETASAWLRENP
jgi:alanyl-tRNA synthetase